VKFLSPADYGNLGLLLLFNSLAKIAFRMGLDQGFFRLYYEQPQPERRRFAGTVALFAAVASTAALLGVIALRVPLARLLFGPGLGSPAWIVLSAADVYLASFSFVPQALLRIEDQPQRFSALAMTRHAINSLLKVGLLWVGLGVTGVVVSDAAASLVFALLLLPTLRRGAVPAWSAAPLRAALAFGLPKVPHGFLLQVQNLADRRILAEFASRADVGLYHQGYTLGQGVKFALAAFEPAWQPFVYSQIGKPDTGLLIARIVTYVWLGFVTLGLGVAVFGRELLMALTFTNPAFWAAAPIVPVVVFAYVLQGAFLLTSIGIGIEKKARYYPLVTFAAAATNIGLDLAWIPRYGGLGAAWATLASYAVMAAIGFLVSRRLYPIPFEAGRLARICLCAAVSFALSRLAPDAVAPALAAKCAALLLFPVLLWGSGFLTREERARLPG
jgi:O-antigen/teichoic acid export membrane protein